MDKSFVYAVLTVLLLTAPAFSEVEETPCTQHYRYNGLDFLELYPENVVYASGEVVKFNYKAVNDFQSPLVEGSVKVIIMYQGLENAAREDDGDIVDDFVAKDDLSLQEGDDYSGTFTWNIPEKAKPGFYYVNVYFLVDDRFNVAGITSMTSVPGRRTSFEVSGEDANVHMLDKGGTMVNGKKYGFRSLLPGFDPETPVEVRTRLLNPGGSTVDIVYELFSWDDTSSPLGQYSRSETASGTKDLVYSLPAMPEGVYVARITASSGDWKSILKIRFFVEGSVGRFIWLGLDEFPLDEGESAVVAFCLSNSAVEPGTTDISFPVKVRLALSDAGGNRVFEETGSLQNVTADIRGGKTVYTSPAQVTWLKLEAQLFDSDDQLVDEAEIVYDYTKFMSIIESLKISAEINGDIEYLVEYVDEYGDPLSGSVVVYLSGPSGEVISLEETDIVGDLSGSFPLEGLSRGEYKIKVVEKQKSVSDEKSLIVESEKSPDTMVSTTASPPATTLMAQEEKADPPWVLLVIVVVVLLVIGVLIISKRRKS